MNNIKIVTICGSMKFSKKMMEVAWELENSGMYVVIQCAYNENKEIANQDNLYKIHHKKIDMSDAIYVVNKDGYVGSSTKGEIEYAKSLGKEILSLEPLE